MKIIDIETEEGEDLIKALRKEGWKKTKEYSWLAFDKGIDFDSYTLKKGSHHLVFEWTNWFEWEISGSLPALEEIARKYQLKIQDE